MRTGKRKFKKHNESLQKTVHYLYVHKVALSAVSCYL